MKRLVCEMCGSNELLKQDDRYVCQSCGTNYTPDEAKKLLIEVSGTVDVSGSTVVVDNSSFVQKSLENARRAKSKEDWEECEKYYNLVEQHDPKNIEAIFYSSYGKAKMAMVDADRFKREQKINVLKKSISVIDDNYDTSDEKYEDNKRMIQQINVDLMALVNGKFVYNQKTSNGVTTNDTAYTYTMFNQLCLGWIESLENIVKMITDSNKSLYILYLIRENYIYVYKHVIKSQVDMFTNKINDVDSRIKAIDSNYQPPSLPERKNGGCYVATCVYGSYDCPEVWTLRRYRDYTLANTWHGRLFIYTYYRISPTIVMYFGETKWFKRIWKNKLDRMVSNLKLKGVEDTPYVDRKW